MKIRVHSYGACGTKFLTGFLDNFDLDSRSDEHNPHCRPEDSQYCDIYILMHADPRNAVLTFIRRHEEQREADEERISRKRRRRGRRMNKINTYMAHTNHRIDGELLEVPLDYDLDQYLDGDAEIFRLEEYFRSWLEFQPPNGSKIIFIEYEKLPDSIAKLLPHLGLGEEVLDKFHFKQRVSDYTSMDESIKEALTYKFKGLIELRDSLDSFMVKNG